MKFDLCCQGGGSKIPALAGGYEAIVNHGFTLSHAIGTSAGAIMAAIAVAGYTTLEIKNILLNTEFSSFLDGGRLKLYNILVHNGIYKGDKLYHFIDDLLKNKGITTFGDLKYDHYDPKYQYRFKAVTCDVTNSKIAIFPDNLPDYGINPDTFEVAKAIRCSISIPFWFRPIKISRSMFVDGGVGSNYAIWAFDSEDEPSHPTFGLSLYTNQDSAPKKTNNPIRLTKALLATMLQSHDKQFIRPDDFINRTISIPVGDTSPIDFGLSQEKKQWLFNQGTIAANNFLDQWSWNRYKRWCVNSRSRNL